MRPGQRVVAARAIRSGRIIVAKGTVGTVARRYGLLSTKYCQGPARSAHWRPADLPTGGHEFCPVVAMKLPSIAPGPEVVDHVSGVTP